MPKEVGEMKGYAGVAKTWCSLTAVLLVGWVAAAGAQTARLGGAAAGAEYHD
jgi:hypothetical protein